MSNFINRIPTGLVNIAGNSIRDALGLNAQQRLGETRRFIDQDSFLNFSAFITDVRARGTAKNNRHIVKVYVPPIFLSAEFQQLTSISKTFKDYFSNYYGMLEMLSRSCEGASFPGFNMQTADQRFQNHSAKFAYLKNLNDVNLVFRCDAEMFEKKFFDTWSMLMVNPYDGFISYKNEISTNIEIYQFDEDQKEVYRITLVNAMPIGMSDLDSTWSAQSDYHRLSVQITFDRIEIETINDPFYANVALTSASRSQPQTLFDKITKEVFDIGKNTVIRSVAKNAPIGSIPGIGSASNALGSFL